MCKECEEKQKMLSRLFRNVPFLQKGGTVSSDEYWSKKAQESIDRDNNNKRFKIQAEYEGEPDFKSVEQRQIYNSVFNNVDYNKILADKSRYNLPKQKPYDLIGDGLKDAALGAIEPFGTVKDLWDIFTASTPADQKAAIVGAITPFIAGKNLQGLINQPAMKKAYDHINLSPKQLQTLISKYGQGGYDKWEKEGFPDIFKQGGILIKPENRGKFTEYAEDHNMGVQEMASKILANKDSYSPTLVKRANFAHVFGGRNYEQGGYLQDSDTYITKDGDATRRGLWANVYLKKKREGKLEDGGSISELGYKDISPYKNASSLMIYSPNGSITMNGVSKDLVGTDEYGNTQLMKANSGTYQFQGKNIKEVPAKQLGGQLGSVLGGVAGSLIGMPQLGSQVGGMIGGAFDNQEQTPMQTVNTVNIPKAETGLKLNNMNFRDQLKKYAMGGEMPKKSYQEGGLVSGEGALPHSEGGVPTVDESGQQIAEVEGGERIFSIEDTAQMEQMAQQLMSVQDPAQQQQMAAQLGMFVAEAIMRQEQVNPSEAGVAGDTSMQQPMMKQGGKMPTSYEEILKLVFGDSHAETFYGE